MASCKNQKGDRFISSENKFQLFFGFPLTLSDDGWSGTDFDRPSFRQMEQMIKAGEVGTVIVKDMSRLGRNYLQVGMYTDIVFVENDVRLVAVSDGVDSAACSAALSLL